MQSSPNIAQPFPQADRHWVRWVLRTGRNWHDLADEVRPTDIDIVDQDHRKLVELTLQLNNAFLSDQFDIRQIQAQKAALENLHAFSEYHFEREQRLIQQYRLPYLDRQQKQHGGFLNLLRGAIADFDQGRLTVALQLKNTVLDWWVEHINGLDNATFTQDGMVERIIRAVESWESMQNVVKTLDIAELDSEHRQLVVLAYWLLQTARQGVATSDNLYLVLYQAVEAHFRHEESLIAAYGLPGLDMHKEQHERFLTALQEFVDGWEKSGRLVSVESLYAVLNWWVTHINEVDAPFFNFEHISAHVFTRVSQWDDFRSFMRQTSVAFIDEDHQRITSLILQIDHLADVRRDPGKAAPTAWLEFFDAILKAVEQHFMREQALMKKHRLPLLNVHFGEHQKFLRIMTGYRDDIAHGRMVISPVLKQCILDWWVDHVNKLDYPTFSTLDLQP